MTGLLSNFRSAVLVAVLLAAMMIVGFGYHSPGGFDMLFAQAVLRWAHVLAGVLWIGLLYYFNFVQIRVMPDISAELKPAVTKHIAPEALFWFRYAALFTVVLGLLIAWLRGYITEALSLGFAFGYAPGDAAYAFIGTGMWLGLIMFFNVWHVIWPAQKIALGLRDADADAKAKAAKRAMVFSRVNTVLSFPMLATMAMYQTLFG